MFHFLVLYLYLINLFVRRIRISTYFANYEDQLLQFYSRSKTIFIPLHMIHKFANLLTSSG